MITTPMLEWRDNINADNNNDDANIIMLGITTKSKKGHRVGRENKSIEGVSITSEEFIVIKAGIKGITKYY